MTSSHHDRALLFRSLHQAGSPLLLANAWDVASARIAVDAGAPAIATTSAGVAWSLGAADGDQLDLDRAVDLIARIAAAVDVPVSADIESGYADTPEGVRGTVERVIAAGAVGINFEDAFHSGQSPLRPVDDQIARIAAARLAADAAGIPLFINARTDTYLRGVGEPSERLQLTLDRAAAYVAAGADGLFVPGVVDTETVLALEAGVTVPLNLMVGPGAPNVAELAKLGVARLSLGSAIAQAAYAVVHHSTRELLGAGSYDTLSDSFDYGKLNELSTARPR